METATPAKSRVTTVVLILILLVLVALLTVMLTVFLPHMNAEAAATTEVPATTVPETDPPTDPPTEPPTEPEPTEPLVALNPHGPLDFQFSGRYLKLLEGESITGIDVSSYQGEVDWEKVAASGVEFVMIRLAFRGYESGRLADDKYAEANLKGAAAAGLKVGVYFFSQALTVEEAEEEADYVIKKLKPYNITMPVVFDWEHVEDSDARTSNMYDKDLLTQCADAFLSKVEEAGYWPMLYFNTSQSRKLFHLDQLEQYDFWLALYSHRMTFPYQVDMWQYTCTGRVPGVSGNCDINIYFPEDFSEPEPTEAVPAG